jgi:alpha-beta hydrolase superfamily lysophospholipase
VPKPGGARAARGRNRSRAVAVVVALVLALTLLSVGTWTHVSQPRPDAFYTPPAGVPATPGALLRGEPFSRGAPAGARAWRILYTTTRDDHTPAVASALVLAATGVPPGPRPVLAWAHGATGITRGCAPSLVDDPLGEGAMPGLDRVLGLGWVVVAVDYPGLGTAGPHPFLIGQGEARAVLDAVRAARRLTAVSLGDRTMVWGHSQGGNAALWTGILAPTYAPDAGVVGVAALAPGTEPAPLARLWGGTKSGVIFAAYLIQAYADAYPDVHFDSYVRATARIQVRELANRCLSAPRFALSGLSALLFGRSIWATDPATGALGRRLADNTPTGPISMPLLLAEGGADTVVPPTVQADYVHRRCAGGGRVDYRTYPGRAHVGLIAPDSPLIPDLVRWTADRLDGTPAASTCPA